MQNKLSSLISNQFPEYKRDSSPLLVSFLEAYYEYLEKRNGAVGLINYNSSNKDIDKTLSDFIIHFYNSYAPLIPKDTVYDKRNLVKRIKELYEAKGTTKSIALLFRLIFNTDISIMFPQEQMLVASGSKWKQESSFRIKVDTINEELLLGKNIYSWSNSSGQFSVINTRTKKIDSSLFEVFYNASSIVKLFEDDIVVAKNELGEILFTGKSVTFVNRVDVLKPGKLFKKGQIFTIPGTVKNTIFRVVDVGTNGELVQTQVIDYGYQNPDSQILSIISIRGTPVQSAIEVITDNDLTNITIRDDLNVTDSGSIFKMFGNGSPESYFAENYLVDDNQYTGTLQNTFDNSISADDISQQESDFNNLSQEEYLQAIAQIKTNSGTIAVYPGIYETNNGNISDSDIKLQDSYYYQIYSYVINSGVTLSKYKDTLIELLHPAGQIVFSNLNLDSNISAVDSIGVFVNEIKKINIQDFVGVDDDLLKFISKVHDINQIVDDTVEKSFITTKDETITTSDSISKEVSPSINDSVITSDTITKSTSVSISDTQSASDIIVANNTFVDPTYMAEIYVADADRDDVSVVKTP